MFPADWFIKPFQLNMMPQTAFYCKLRKDDTAPATLKKVKTSPALGKYFHLRL
jgi:hypothetical protein